MGWRYWKMSHIQNWEYISDGPNPELLAIIDHIEGMDYLVSHAVNMKNCGHYSALKGAKKAALEEGIASDKIAPISTEDGYKQSFIDSTI